MGYMQVTKGERAITIYTFGTKRARHTFCKFCGVQSFYYPRSNPNGVAVTVRCVDPPSRLNVTVAKFDGRNWEDSMAQTGIGRLTNEPHPGTDAAILEKESCGWDAENGVWKGHKALQHADPPPKPLVIFGYGSLCWKPDETLGAFESFPCVVRGWTRLFAQRSTDHRGTPASPGLVVTLVETRTLQGLPNFDASVVPDCVCGRAYVVPDSQAEAVLAELDFREKGGYSRRTVIVERIDDTPHKGTEVKSLLYSGSVDNPNFWWGDDGQGLDLDRAASIIAHSVGPSGPNLEYLKLLAGFLQEQNYLDNHITELEARVDRLLEETSAGSLSTSKRARTE